jgi:hypothetical protein
MTTSVQTNRPSITKAELKQEIKKLLPFSVNKIGETLFDLFVTAIVLGITIAWLATLQNQIVTFGEMTIYIITGFVLINILRVVQDFDDHTTVDELAERQQETEALLKEVHRIVKAESTTITDAELDDRLSKM